MAMSTVNAANRTASSSVPVAMSRSSLKRVSRMTSGAPNACRKTASAPAHRRRAVAARAADPSTVEKPAVAQVAEKIGLPTDEGLFGFKPFAELWVGRLAMMGFLTSMVEEGITGQGTLGQIGFETPSVPLTVGIISIFAGLTLAATFNTVLRATGKKMSTTEVKRYRQFLGIKNEDAEISEQQAAMKNDWKKGGGDFTAPLNMNTVVDAARLPKPVDEFLNMKDRDVALKEADAIKAAGDAFSLDSRAETDAAAADFKARQAAGPSMSLAARTDVLEQKSAAEVDFDYAKMVELNQGRLAMLGFLAAVGIEAATGAGILGQLVLWGKWSGILGPMSGF